ncbi:MAG: hypothetical protein IPM98_04290 [Lewinellaceae bacterium]|nr:hypothetical protein [Lewinellaceae bacterium]
MQGANSPLFFRLAIAGSLTVLTVLLGYRVERPDFGAFITAYGVFFALYAWVLTRPEWSAADQRWFIGLGIALRAVLLFSIPNLSDDFYRFLWDGRLAAHGIHPFAHPPVFFMENQMHLAGITPELFQKLNSPDYHTVYPPVCQGVFWLAAKLFPESLSGGVFVLKMLLFLCELGTLAVLAPASMLERRWRIFGLQNPIAAHADPVDCLVPAPMLGGRAVIAYALNPLIILEITGNCHFEGAMLFFLLAGIAALQRRYLPGAALFWALATASKLVPLLFLPIVLVYLGRRAGFRFVLFFGACCLALFLPLLDLDILRNMAGSLNLYFRQFAFNAGGYYVLKAIGKALAPPALDVGRTLGPILGAVVFAGVWAIALLRPEKPGVPGGWSLTDKLVLAATLYLALATTVHPWYIVLPFGLSLLTRWRFPLVWTAVAALSYSHYAGGGFQENYAWIAVEYAVVLLFVFVRRA